MSGLIDGTVHRAKAQSDVCVCVHVCHSFSQDSDAAPKDAADSSAAPKDDSSIAPPIRESCVCTLARHSHMVSSRKTRMPEHVLSVGCYPMRFLREV